MQSNDVGELVAVPVSDLDNLIEELHKLPAPDQERIFNLPFFFHRLAPALTEVGLAYSLRKDFLNPEEAELARAAGQFILWPAMEGCPVTPDPMLLQHVRPILRRQTRAHEIYGW